MNVSRNLDTFSNEDDTDVLYYEIKPPEVPYQNSTIDPCFRGEKHGRDSLALDPVVLSQHPGMCGGGPGVLRDKQLPSLCT